MALHFRSTQLWRKFSFSFWFPSLLICLKDWNLTLEGGGWVSESFPTSQDSSILRPVSPFFAICPAPPTWCHESCTVSHLEHLLVHDSGTQVPLVSSRNELAPGQLPSVQAGATFFSEDIWCEEITVHYIRGGNLAALRRCSNSIWFVNYRFSLLRVSFTQLVFV